MAEDSKNLNRDQVLKRMLKMPPKPHDKDKLSQKSRKRDEVCKEQTKSEISDGNFTNCEVSDKKR